MLAWIIQISIISIIFIFLVHHLIMFFKTTLTVPKIKDLVNSPNQKYENIFNTLSNNNINNYSNSYTSIDLLPSDISASGLLSIENTEVKTNSSMKDELKSFLKQKLNTGTDISIIPNSFSNF